MYDAVQMFFLAFIIGLTGALAPGPTLVATINASLEGNWSAGPKIIAGHMVAELAIFILIVLGLATVALPYTTAIAGIGGCALIAFGAVTVAGSRTATMSGSPDRAITSPYLSGLVTSAANPYFWIWWLTIGSAMVIAGLEGGVVLAGIFMAGHWSADLGWYTAVSVGVSQGKTILSDTAYRLVMGACGLFLMVFGIYYLSGVFIRA
jgi:threonine/homoserine/homoserine lactone efflux protein